MRVSFLSLLALLQAYAILASTIPSPQDARDGAALNDLFKRKGGGGGGKGGSSGGSSSGSTGSSSGSTGGTTSGSSGTSGGSTSSGSGSSSSGSRTGSTSNSGGATTSGSGVRPAYGSGGAYYGGGAAVPYTAGAASARGLRPLTLLPLAGLGFLGGAWLYGAYLYPYNHPYTYYNASAGQNQTKPVDCLCQQYSECGCDDPDDDQSFFNSVIGNGTDLDPNLVRVADYNGTSTIFLNGTLPNGTTASGGSDDGSTSAGWRLGSGLETNMGWVCLAAVMGVAVMGL